MEVQHHGLLFEDKIIQGVTGYSKWEYQNHLSNSYTSSMDIVQGILSDHNYSIKVSKNAKSVGCGDILRFNAHCAETEFKMVVGKWNQCGNKKIYDTIYEFNISPENNKIIWSGITSSDLIPFVQYVKNIPKNKTDEIQNRKIWKQKRQEIYDKKGKGLISIDAKINSQNRRVQCSFKIDDMISSGIPVNKYNKEYKGLQLPYAQISQPRNHT